MKSSDSVNKKYFDLSHQQQRIWYIENIYPNTSMYNIAGYTEIKGDFDFKILEQALNIFTKNNEGCRLELKEFNGQVKQYVSEYKTNQIDFFDFSKYDNSMERFNEWISEVEKEPFQLYENKLYYIAMFKVNDNFKGYLAKFHHIICDGWSVEIFSNQICENYSNIYNKTQTENKINSYIDYLEIEHEYLNSDKFIINREFWLNKFNHLDNKEYYKYSYNVTGDTKSFQIDEALSNNIAKYVHDNRISLATFFIGIFYLYEYKRKNRNEFTIGTPVFNRINRKEKNIFGLFTSNMPFRTKILAQEGTLEFIKRISKEYKAFLRNQRYPYDILVNDLDIINKGYNQLFNVCINYYNMRVAADINGIQIENHQLYSGSQAYDLQMVIKDWDECNITLTFDYNDKLFDEESIKSIYKCLLNICNQVILNQKKCKDINLITEYDLYNEIYSFNNTFVQYPQYNSILDLFEDQVNTNPNNIAVSIGEITISYKKLNERSNRLSRYILENTNKNIIALIMEHSIETIVSILAILKTGKAYLPISFDTPEDRIYFMLKECEIDLILTNYELDEKILVNRNVIYLNNLNISDFSANNIEINRNENDLVYIIYTSGSSGMPKGVMIQNKNLINYIFWAKKVYCKEEKEVFPLFTSLSFDLTVTSIFTPLISGNEIRIYLNDEDKHAIYKILDENCVTVMKLTPAHLQLIRNRKIENPSIKRFIVGGDDLKVTLAEDISRNFNNNIEIYNEYGPTEATVGCMIYKYNKYNKDISVPIGIPIENSKIYILNEDLAPVPQGQIGELFISGAGVGRGYINNKELTEKSFFVNPYSKDEMMYRSGDLALRLKNGVIAYKGRKDFQVKINGYRIELGEIEENILSIDGVRDVYVANFKKGILSAYLVNDKNISIEFIKSCLAKKLPEYMIPKVFIKLDEIPLNKNGKVDKKILEKIELSDQISNRIGIIGEKEKLLIDTLSDVLGVKNIKLTDNFYNLGGDSIKSIQISNKLANINYKLKVKDILSNPVIFDMSQHMLKDLRKMSKDGVCRGNLKATPIIEKFLESNIDNINYYNQSIMLDVNGTIRDEELECIVDNLIKHHDTLRLNYNPIKKELYYNNKYLERNNSVRIYNLTNISENNISEEIERISKENKKAFDITNKLLFRVCLFKLREDKSKILLIAHHLIIDGMSWRIILQDMENIIKQIRNNQVATLPSKTSSLKEWTDILSEYVYKIDKEEVNFWNDVINKEDKTPQNAESALLTRKYIKASLTKEETKNLLLNCNYKYNTKINDLLITALVLTLNKLSSFYDFIIELEGHGREEITENDNVSRTVGWFTNIYPVFFHIKNKDIDDEIIYVKDHLRSIPNHGFNYSLLKQYNMLIDKEVNRHMRFNYLGDYNINVEKDIFRVSKVFFEDDVSNRNILSSLMDINCLVIDKSLQIMIQYNSGEYSEEFMTLFINNYIDYIKKVITHCLSCEKRLTSSDFDMVNLSQDELDSIIGYSKNKLNLGDYI